MSAVDQKTSHDDVAKPGSDRSFGFVFAAVFTLIALWPTVSGHAPRWIALAIAMAFGLAAIAVPRILHPLNYVWYQFGLSLHKIVSPIVMGGVFFLSVVPMGLAMRLLGKDLLALNRHRELKSYWIARKPPGPEPKTMKRQF
jgi:predicted membrane metal-binding protein